MLESLLDSYPQVPRLHYYLGYARVKAGDTWGALTGYERALELSGDQGYWLPLGSLYLELGLNAHALHAYRQVLSHKIRAPMIDEVRGTVADLEQDLLAMARELERPAAQVERGFHRLESGQRATHDQDFSAAIADYREAVKLLGDWPVPHNNLALALFHDGQPEQAMDVTRQVLARDPNNIYALSNAVRFLAWTGREMEAQGMEARLRDIEPQGIEDTWDIEIEGAHNFVANGFVVHNSKITQKYPSVYMMEPGAHGEILSIAFAGHGQHQDAGGKVIHCAPNTSSKIISKSISKDGGRAGYRGLVKVQKGAVDSRSTVNCDALILDEKSRSDTYPYMEIEEDRVTIGHEATVSKIGDEQLFYLQSRGIAKEEAAAMIVSGFIEPIVKELPMEYAVEMNRLIQLQMEGSVG